MTKKRRIKIIPEPKFIEDCPGDFDITKNLTIGYLCDVSQKKECKRITEYLRQALRSDKTHVKMKQKSSLAGKSSRALFIYVQDTKKRFSAAQCLLVKERVAHKQGYVLYANENIVICKASTCEGLFNATQTLIQLMNQSSKSIPCTRIKDWPDLEKRCAHIDFSVLAPNLQTVKNLIDQYSCFKINTVFMTYHDKFSYARFPEISHPDAFSKDEVLEIVSFAKDRYIDIIPVIQSFGHSANVLVHDKYAHLREGNNNITQFCPQHPGTLDFFKQLAEEVMQAHDSKFFHIGADETYFLGTCPKCSQAVKKKGKIGLYMDYVLKACEFIKSRKRIPMIWDDMLCQSPADIHRFDKEAIICYWDYFPNDDKNPFVFFRNDGWYCDMKYWSGKKWWGGDFINSGRCKDIRELDNKKFTHYKEYFFETEDTRYFTPLPFYRFYRDKGFTTVGCSAVRGGEYGCNAPNYTRRLSNVMKMLDTVVQNNGNWAMTTTWSEMLSSDDLCLYLFATLAEHAWSHRGTTRSFFDTKYSSYIHGTQDPFVIEAMFLLGQYEPPICFNSEDRSDVNERGMYGDAESYKELVDKRLARWLKMPESQLEAEKIKLNEMIHNANSIIKLLNDRKKQIKKGKNIIKQIEHGAQMLLHKVRQVELFLQIEQVLKNTAVFDHHQIRIVLRRLSQLMEEMQALLNQDKRLFAKNYLPLCVKDRTQKLFQGEKEKMAEYRDGLSALL